MVALGRPIPHAALLAASREQLIEALDHAISVVASYQFDLRNSERVVGFDLAARGFCEGEFYQDALPRVRRLLGIEEE